MRSASTARKKSPATTASKKPDPPGVDQRLPNPRPAQGVPAGRSPSGMPPTPFLRDLLDPNIRTELDQYLYGREIIDFLLDSSKLGFAPDEFVQVAAQAAAPAVFHRVQPEGASGAGASHGGTPCATTPTGGNAMGSVPRSWRIA